jgi:hypothetical protein
LTRSSLQVLGPLQRVYSGSKVASLQAHHQEPLRRSIGCCQNQVDRRCCCQACQAGFRPRLSLALDLHLGVLPSAVMAASLIACLMTFSRSMPQNPPELRHQRMATFPSCRVIAYCYGFVLCLKT